MEYPKKELSRSRVEWVRRTQAMDVLWLACLTLVVIVMPPGWRSLLLASRPLKRSGWGAPELLLLFFPKIAAGSHETN